AGARGAPSAWDGGQETGHHFVVLEAKHLPDRRAAIRVGPEALGVDAVVDDLDPLMRDAEPAPQRSGDFVADGDDPVGGAQEGTLPLGVVIEERGGAPRQDPEPVLATPRLATPPPHRHPPAPPPHPP